MNKHFVTSFLLLVCMVSVLAYSQSTPSEGPENKLEWHTSLVEANALSNASHKPIFAFFTGSDWCGWCIKLQNNVFSKPEFIAWAKKNVILLELDFPRQKQLPPELAQQNNSLQQALHITGFPTVWLLYVNKDESTNNINITTLGSLGYPPNAIPGKEQEQFLNEANRILSSQGK